jgi:HTH-type transcriptional regulator / antitoxin HipB
MNERRQKLAVIIRAERERRGWTGRELARRAGVSSSTVSHVENSQNDASFDTAMRLCHTLQIDPRSIWQPPKGTPDWGKAVLAMETIEALALEMAKQMIAQAAQRNKERSW